MSPPLQLVMTADDRLASLYFCRRSPRGAWAISLRENIASPWEDDHERGRPALLGRGPTANAAQHFASTGHQQEEQTLRFARDIAALLDRTVACAPDCPISLFAPPRMLGALRSLAPDLPANVSLHEGDFGNLPPHKLAAHAAIAEALNWPAAAHA